MRGIIKLVLYIPVNLQSLNGFPEQLVLEVVVLELFQQE